ncbi:DUF3597 domain-containing protein [Roseomonas hellenica]|uniref:DUF3597 domain-containing protein n=1 Tax=Plastoroseomonas hellenica TaxID=2687306 RepID=A0ABS5EWT5_9PROT|nr:DUF3597 domain-containing protein [Plastoroseomonas hellenica]MBR0664760.1 DUF3597 domain-containing protein [Plastoroseomonas hellenica]
MSIFRLIMAKVFGQDPSPEPAPHPGAPDPNASSAAAAGATAAPAPIPPIDTTPVAPSAAAAAAGAPIDVEAALVGMAAKDGRNLDWRRSIVDLMKLLGLDSSLAARQTLAKELHYSGNPNDSAGMNLWLHGQVMRKLAENGGKVPSDLLP